MGDWAAYKPLLTALALPPVPFLVLILVGARLILPRRGLGYLVLLTGVLGIWVSQCQVTAVFLQDHVLKPPAPLQGAELSRLQAVGKAYGQQQGVARRLGRAGAGAQAPVAIVALGAGRDALAPEYGVSDLTHFSAERLRYAIWLGQRTGLPIGFSGGIGWSQQGEVGASEAETAARVAQQFYGVTLRWTETRSADTRQNALLTVAMLAEQGVGEVVVVTDSYHMPRAMRMFNEAARREAALHPDKPPIKVTPAPAHHWHREGALDWLPSVGGATNVRLGLKEAIAQFTGS
ncbi:MAG: YdcF family protein [Aquabacterium sp.]|nr:YdcF family protein [Aquabacterium sp.]